MTRGRQEERSWSVYDDFPRGVIYDGRKTRIRITNDSRANGSNRVTIVYDGEETEIEPGSSIVVDAKRVVMYSLRNTKSTGNYRLLDTRD